MGFQNDNFRKSITTASICVKIKQKKVVLPQSFASLLCKSGNEEKRHFAWRILLT